MKREPKPKVQPWPGSTFALSTRWEDWGDNRHLWAYLERRAAGRFGRLQAMHAVVPNGRKGGTRDALFGSAQYRQATLDATRKLFQQAGVPDDQADRFMNTIAKEFPWPTPAEIFEERMANPMLTAALGERVRELSYYRTGVPELTEEDQALIQERLQRFVLEVKNDPEARRKLLKLIF